MATKRIGVVFPGYGQQSIGMGKDLYDQLRPVQEMFEQAAGVAEMNFVKLMFASSDQEISSVRGAYTSIYLFEASLYAALSSYGLKPDFVAGYGIGEYAAAYATGSLSFVDGMYILNKYAQFYHEFLQENPRFQVLRIVRDFDTQILEELCKSMSLSDQKIAVISAQNGEHAFYVAGDEAVIEKIHEYCSQQVIRKVRIIGPEYGLHSFLVDSVAEQLKLYYHKIKFSELAVPMITNVDGVYVTTPDALESAMMRKINNPVQWLEVMKGFEGCDVILSVGPGDQLIEWFKEVYPDKEYHVVSSLSSLEEIRQYLSSPIVPSPQDDTAAASGSQTSGSQEPASLYEADLVNEKPTDFDVDDEE